MSKTTYGTVRYIDSYEDAPASARYILRQQSDAVVFESYNGFRRSVILLEFPLLAINDKKMLRRTLTECRKFISPDRSTIYVEKPDWMYPEDSEPFEDVFEEKFPDDRSESNWRDDFGSDTYDDEVYT